MQKVGSFSSDDDGSADGSIVCSCDDHICIVDIWLLGGGLLKAIIHIRAMDFIAPTRLKLLQAALSLEVL